MTPGRLTLAEANRRLPLVAAIVADVVEAHAAFARDDAAYRAERARRDPDQVRLNGLARARRAWRERVLAFAAELTPLGAVLEGPVLGDVSFEGEIECAPDDADCREASVSALLCWRAGEPCIETWRPAGTSFSERRALPVLVGTK